MNITCYEMMMTCCEYLGVLCDLNENNLVSTVHTGKQPRFQLLKEYVLEFLEAM